MRTVHPSAAFALGALLATAVFAGDAAVLVEIDGLSTGELRTAGFRLERPQAVRVTAVDLEAHWHPGALTEAWVLESSSRRAVWRMGDREPSEKEGAFRFYDEVLDLPAGTYEVYYATYPDEWEISDDESWWEGTRRILRRFTESKLLRREDYGEAVGELELVVKSHGEPLGGGDVEKVHSRLRGDAVVALYAEDDDETEEVAFVLDRELDLEVYAVGELDRKHAYDYGWILDARTRETVWKMSYERSEPAGGAEKNRLVRERIRLPAGEYAAFFVTDGSHDPGDWNVLPPLDPAFWGLTAWARPGRGSHEVAWHRKGAGYQDLPEERALVEIVGVGNDEHRSTLFTLRKPAKVRVYAVGEGLPSGMADYGWIVDATRKKPVWKMTYEGTAHAGGSSRNRLADEVLELAAGTYVVGFKTDGAHAYGSWHWKEPSRPERWGISLFGVGEGFDPTTVRVGFKDTVPIAEITRVGNNRHEKVAFRLEKKTVVAVRAVGEGMKGEMYDYGWIEDLRTGEVVWKMTFERTEHAGGHYKNRIHQGLIPLDAGSYVLHFVTDDSHAYGAWNTRPPGIPEAWGIVLSAVE